METRAAVCTSVEARDHWKIFLKARVIGMSLDEMMLYVKHRVVATGWSSMEEIETVWKYAEEVPGEY